MSKEIDNLAKEITAQAFDIFSATRRFDRLEDVLNQIASLLEVAVKSTSTQQTKVTIWASNNRLSTIVIEFIGAILPALKKSLLKRININVQC